jgi:hypothetical protein
MLDELPRRWETSDPHARGRRDAVDGGVVARRARHLPQDELGHVVAKCSVVVHAPLWPRRERPVNATEL